MNPLATPQQTRGHRITMTTAMAQVPSMGWTRLSGYQVEACAVGRYLPTRKA